MPPPFPAVTVLSVSSVISVRLLFVHDEKFVVVAASGRAVAMAATIRVLAAVVIAPGMEPVASAAASTPPAVTYQGSPEATAPRKAIIRPT
jgi:hypothetical protein